MTKPRQEILARVEDNQHINTAGFTARHFKELDKMVDEKLVREVRVHSQRSDLIDYFLNNI